MLRDHLAPLVLKANRVTEASEDPKAKPALMARRGSAVPLE